MLQRKIQKKPLGRSLSTSRTIQWRTKFSTAFCVSRFVSKSNVMTHRTRLQWSSMCIAASSWITKSKIARFCHRQNPLAPSRTAMRFSIVGHTLESSFKILRLGWKCPRLHCRYLGYLQNQIAKMYPKSAATLCVRDLRWNQCRRIREVPRICLDIRNLRNYLKPPQIDLRRIPARPPSLATVAP